MLPLWLIRFAGVIVPRRLRADWRQEWEAELRYREALLSDWEKLNWRTKLDLLWRSLGAFRDALWLQQLRWEDDMFQDLRSGLRMLLNKPGFTSIAVLTLALGIGANTAIFSVVNAVLLRPLPYKHSDELRMFWFTDAQGDGNWLVTPAAHLNLKMQNSVFTDVAAFSNSGWSANLTGNGDAERLQGFRVTANFFEVLGESALQGRTFLSGEDRPDNNNVVVISHDLWQRRFGGDPGTIGKSLLLNGEPYNVIGVMPDDFRFVLKTDVWTTLAFTGAENNPGAADLHQILRLKAGVSNEQARAEADNLLRPYTINPNAELVANLKPLQMILMGEDLSRWLFILFGAVGFILLIACANVANLLLARASVRRRELAIRAALGAGRIRLVRHLLVESAMLAVVGGACGLLLANWSIGFLVAGLPPDVVAKNSHVARLTLDGWALGFTFALSLFTTIIFGLIPAIQVSGVNLNEALKEGGRSDTQGRGQNRFRSLLVVTEIALAMVLLVGAGLMTKSFWRFSNVDRGFETAGVLTARIDPAGDSYREPQEIVAFYGQLLERVAAIPGVKHAGLTNGFLDRNWQVAVEEHPEVPEDERLSAARNPVSAGYFGAMSIPLRVGRFFTERDVENAPQVAIIDEVLARRHFPNEDPIGKHLRFESGLREIVGIVGATRAWKRFTAGDVDAARVYIPYQQENWGTMALIVKAQAGDPTKLIPAIRSELAAIDKDQPIHSFTLLEESVNELSADQRFSTLLMAAFAVIAAVLAAVGIYGVMSYSVTRRTQEIGIRMALGAQTGNVMRLVVKQGMILTAVGVTIGLLASIGLTRLLESFLFGVSAMDRATYALTTVLLLGVVLLACYIPARRATKVDPMVALRSE